jgi:two-component system NtrC family response regulator
MSADGQFRRDLFYRLSVAPLHLPPLRERREDVPLLVRAFADRICKRFGRPAVDIGNPILRKLEMHYWPGNVRELENVIERLIVFSKNDIADINDLPDEMLQPQMAIGRALLSIPPEGVSLAELEKDLIVAALERNQWNQTRAASFLHVTRNILIYRMQKYRLGPYRDLPSDAPIAPPDGETDAVESSEPDDKR